MASPAIRAFHLARTLADDFDVTLVAPPGSRAPNGVRLVDAPEGQRSLFRLLRGFDTVISQKLPAWTLRRLGLSQCRLIYDLYTPAWPESLQALAASQASTRSTLLARAEALTQRLALFSADAFVCTSERQLDFWLGALGSVGRVGIEAYRVDPNLRHLIDVVPFGLPEEPPTRSGPALREVVPGIYGKDRILIWSGGVIEWTDPVTVIEAVARVAETRPDLRLVFLGFPRTPSEEPAMARRAFERAGQLGLRDRVVFFVRDWVPYEQRGSFLLDADVGVAAYFDTLEARLAYRARLMDYLWAGLPVITTRGDTLGNFVLREGIGAAPAPTDVAAWVAGIKLLLDDRRYVAARERVAAVRPDLEWSKLVGPLVRLAAVPGARVDHVRARATEMELLRVRVAISRETRGRAGATRHAASRLADAFR
jgi:glycosyltransferase involved in cell wall biosynthesis